MKTSLQTACRRISAWGMHALGHFQQRTQLSAFDSVPAADQELLAVAIAGAFCRLARPRSGTASCRAPRYNAATPSRTGSLAKPLIILFVTEAMVL